MPETVQQENTENLIDLVGMLAGLWRRVKSIYWLLLLITCITTIGGVLNEHLQYRKSYEASASFIVSTGIDDSSSTAAYYNKVTLEQLNTTFPYILTSGILSEYVAEDLGLEYVPGSISASVLEETNLFQIRVIASEPELAWEILQAVISNYPSVARYVIGDTTFKLIDESGIPTSPRNAPAYRRAAFSGMFKGILFCLIILVAQVFLSNTIKTQDDLKHHLNIKYLNGIPAEHQKKRSRSTTPAIMIDHPSASYAFKEAIDVLQVRLNRIMNRQNMKTLVVTSTLASEGKTTIACNLACAVSKRGYKVLLIDSDFRHPSVAPMLNLKPSEKGIEDVLKGNANPEDIICQYKDSTLYVMPGLAPQTNVSRLYKNGSFQKLLNAYRETMDLIIIDTPPCGIMNDAALAAESADGILLVIRQDYAHRDKILEGVELLSGSDTPIVGYVINNEETGIGSYNYGRYGYGKYGYGRYGYHSKYGYGSSKDQK